MKIEELVAMLLTKDHPHKPTLRTREKKPYTYPDGTVGTVSIMDTESTGHRDFLKFRAEFQKALKPILKDAATIDVSKIEEVKKFAQDVAAMFTRLEHTPPSNERLATALDIIFDHTLGERAGSRRDFRGKNIKDALAVFSGALSATQGLPDPVREGVEIFESLKATSKEKKVSASTFKAKHGEYPSNVFKQKRYPKWDKWIASHVKNKQGFWWLS